MKKIILFCFIALAMTSCKPTSATTTKIDSKAEMAIKGNWTLTSVTYPNSDVIKITSFGLADSKCFEGSSWKFVSSNNSGEMSINKAECAALTSPIKWFVNKDGEFILKVVNAGEKAKKVRDGYVVKLASQTAQSFQLIDQITVGNKVTQVVYQFQKN